MKSKNDLIYFILNSDADIWFLTSNFRKVDIMYYLDYNIRFSQIKFRKLQIKWWNKDAASEQFLLDFDLTLFAEAINMVEFSPKQVLLT